MLQPIHGPRSNDKLPSAMQSFEGGVASAAADVSRSYLSSKMQEMFEEKKTNRALAIESDARSRTATGFTNFLTSANIIPKSQRAETLATLSNMDQAQQSAIVNHLVTNNGGLDLSSGTNAPSSPTFEPSAPQGVPQTNNIGRRGLPPGTAPMLNREDMPAEAETSSPPVNPQAIASSLSRQQGQNEMQKNQIREEIPTTPQEQPKWSYEKEVNRLEDEKQRLLSSPKNRSKDKQAQILSNYKTGMQIARERRASDLSQEKYESKKQEPMRKATNEYVAKVQKSAAAAAKINDALFKMRALRAENDIGPISSWALAKNREASAKYSIYAKELLPIIKEELFSQRGFSDREFSRIENLWIPTAGETGDTLKGKEDGFQHLADRAIKSYEKMRQYQLPDGSYPTDISDKVFDALKKEEKEIRTDFLNGPQAVVGLKDNEQFDQPPEKGAKVGQQLTRNGTIIEWTGSSWKKVK